MPLNFDIIIDDEKWTDIDEISVIFDGVRKAMEAVLPELDGTCSVMLSNNAKIQDLNRDFRGKDKPTNVLSFPDGEEDEDGVIYLGDIAMAYETLVEESQQDQDKTFISHLTHLAIHGTLHLIGYDHIDEDEALEMEALEVKIMRECGYASPYGETGA